VRTNRFEPHPAVLAKDRTRQILALALRANHDGNQSQLGRIVPNSFKPGLSVHSEGSKQCIVPAYGKIKLKDCYTNANCLSNWPGNARQLENEIKGLVVSVRGKTITENQLDGSIRNLSASIQSFQPKEKTFAEVADVSILAGRRRAVRTPANRRGTAKFRWKQRKSGSRARAEPPGLIKNLKRLEYLEFAANDRLDRFSL
jgi:hypothetical protein